MYRTSSGGYVGTGTQLKMASVLLGRSNLIPSVVEPFHFGPAPAPASQDCGSSSSSSPLVNNLLLKKKVLTNLTYQFIFYYIILYLYYIIFYNLFKEMYECFALLFQYCI